MASNNLKEISLGNLVIRLSQNEEKLFTLNILYKYLLWMY